MTVAVQTDAAALLRNQLPEIIAGLFFVLVGLVAFAIAAIRRKSGVRLLVWLGVWTCMFGIEELLKTSLIRDSLPLGLRPPATLVLVACTYLVLVAAAFTFLELTTGTVRSLLKFKLAADSAVAVFGIGAFLLFGSEDALLNYNGLLAVIGLVLLSVVVIVPALSRRYLVLRHHRVLTIGTLVFIAQALHMNLSHTFGYYSPGILSSVGFAVLLLSLGYTAMGMIVENEHRLLSIDSELALARQLQFSILPAEVPAISKLRIAAKYLPMTAVAGDFYQFIPVDDHRVGFLIADVSGHGVPAALIASMIKTAMHSVDGCANEPSEVLRRLGKVLSIDLKGQFVSAAYLWLDTETRQAKYAAAGHPPLLLWRGADRKLERIESNGLIFGVLPEFEIPQRCLDLCSGDHLLLYTDGVTEPENQAGEAFGDQRLEQVIRSEESSSANHLSKRLVSEISAWVPSSSRQQDDITLIVIDVL